MNIIKELKWVKSEYLCENCKKPLYFRLGPKIKEACVNPDCDASPSSLNFLDPKESERLRKEMKQVANQLRLKIARTNKAEFIQHIYRERIEILKSLYLKCRANFKNLLALDAMLAFVKNINFVGQGHSSNKFESIIPTYIQFFENQMMVEDVNNKRVLISADKEIYMLKYWDAIMTFYKTFGIFSERALRPSEAFAYEEIDSAVKVDVGVNFPMDFDKWFENRFDHIVAIKYALEMYHFTALLHRYDPTGMDIATLFGLFWSVKKDVEEWSLQGLKRHYDRTTGSKEDFGDFMRRFIMDPNLAPVVVYNGRNYRFDRYTLLFYIMYLIGQNIRKSPEQTDTGLQTINRKKGKASQIFVQKIRQRLRDFSYRVFPEEGKGLIVREQNEEHEFDVIAIKEKPKEVVIIEAKYKDLSPSSLTGLNLLDQEVLDPDNGLLAEAIKHQGRLDFFRKNSERFKRPLSLNSDTTEYSLTGLIVTKHIPIISSYKDISLITYYEFCERFSRSSS